MALAVMVVGLGFGDEGKGGIVDFITRKTRSTLTVRFSGGAQASHAVVTDDGRDHRFSQFGSGTFTGARTFLSRHMLFNPITIAAEARHLIEIGVPDPYGLVTVDNGALITTPFHIAAGRIREIARNNALHGSCGLGIGETVRYDWDVSAAKWGHPAVSSAFPRLAEVPFAVDLKDLKLFREKCALLCQRLRDDVAPLFEHGRPAMYPEWEILNDFEGTMSIFEPYVERVAKHIAIEHPDWLREELVKDQTLVFEGAQGVLLDENYGFHPHTTWSTTTFANAESLVRGVKGLTKTRIGVLRGYMTRHGAGPFVTEDSTMPVPKSEHNGRGRWQADFRMGHFDAVMARYALDVIGGCDELAITCLDHLKGEVRAAWEYQQRPYLDPRFTTAQVYSAIPRVDRLAVNRLDVGWQPGPELDAHLVKQEALTNRLKNHDPVYREFYNEESFLDQIEDTLETPITIRSHGPKASDKRVCPVKG
jgi:adenylosuccinate synthase